METTYSNPQTDILNQLLAIALKGQPVRIPVQRLTAAQVLTGFSVPVLMFPAPGAGYAIRVLKASNALYCGAFQAYSTHLQLALYTNVNYPQFLSIATFLGNAGAATDSHQPMAQVIPATGEDWPIVENAALYMKVLGGNPTGGDSPLDNYITIEVIEL